jgi:endonuclease III
MRENIYCFMQLALVLERPAFLERVRARLLVRFGPQRDAWRLDPVGQLVLAMISSRTRDEVSRAAFERLRQSYARWDVLARAAPAKIETLIQAVTFAERKAGQLPRALRMIIARSGDLNLDFLAAWEEEAARQ